MARYRMKKCKKFRLRQQLLECLGIQKLYKTTWQPNKQKFTKRLKTGALIEWPYIYNSVSQILVFEIFSCGPSKKYRRKNKIQMNCVSHYSWKSQCFEMTHGNSLSLFLPVLIFYEMYYPTHLPTSHRTLSNKRGIYERGFLPAHLAPPEFIRGTKYWTI